MFVKWPWYTTGRPPVKFRSIWRSFDAPTVNRVTAKSFCVLQQNPLCRGILTADVLVQGLSRGAIAARKLKGVKRDKDHEGYTGSAPYCEGKSLRPVEVVLLRVSMTRKLNRYARLSICCLSS